MARFKRWVSLLGFAAGIAGVAIATQGIAPKQTFPYAQYKIWNKVNGDRVYMPPMLAALCIGPKMWDADPKNPHVPAYFNVYVNPIGEKAMLTPRTSIFPDGSVIVKEKFKSKSSAVPELLTVMIKRNRGFDDANGDWEYLAVNGNFTQQSNVNKKVCQSCHIGQKANDFVYRSYVSHFASK